MICDLSVGQNQKERMSHLMVALTITRSSLEINPTLFMRGLNRGVKDYPSSLKVIIGDGRARHFFAMPS